MDTKKKIITGLLLFAAFFSGETGKAYAQDQTVTGIQFCNRSYEYGIGRDTITVHFNLLDDTGKRVSDITPRKFDEMFSFLEDGKEITNRTIRRVSSGVRIPEEYTFSILLDQGIPEDGKHQIIEAVERFVNAAPEQSVFVSFYGDEVSNTRRVTSENFNRIRKEFMQPASGKAFYSGVYSKLAEFSSGTADYLGQIRAREYVQDTLLSSRAALNPGKNILMIFADGSTRPDVEELDFIKVTDFQSRNSATMPCVNAFYYRGDRNEESGDFDNIEIMLKGITHPRDSLHQEITRLAGCFAPSADLEHILNSFQTVVETATYDYEIAYSNPGKIYAGNVDYKARWGRNTVLGETTFTIGSAERPWPEKKQSIGGAIVELLVALLVTLVTFGFFFLIVKIAVPGIQSKAFESKYYRKYEPEENVQRRICHYCKKELHPGEIIVTKCNHWLHKHCWEQNGYKCSEFGQNCKTGIQQHVDYHEVFTWASLKECSQTIAGFAAGLVSWIIYEICGRGGFHALSKSAVGLVLDNTETHASLIDDCAMRTSSFLMIGLLLGFFISLVFRYKDDIRNKEWEIWLKIVGLSCLTALIGMVAFAIGADIMCLLLSWTDKMYIPWYCSLPAYMLFSISVSLALTIKSTIPVKSALLGGLCSAAIGFLILYFTTFMGQRYEWLNMLLDFIIYGGGLGASLVTARMLAERYFLVIQNGVKAGQRIPIHKWMNANGGGNKVSIGMTGECEIQMNWEKSNKVAKEHAQLFIDHEKNLPVIKPLATGVLYNTRAELPVNKTAVLSNGDTFRIGDTIFRYEEV